MKADVANHEVIISYTSTNMTRTSSSSHESTQPIPSIPDSISDVLGTRSSAKFHWEQVIELGYIESADGNGVNIEVEEDVSCFQCGRVATEYNASLDVIGSYGRTQSQTLMKCSRCQVARYCSRECQVANWKGSEGNIGHKFSCAAYKRVGKDMTIIYGDDKDIARQDILSRIRLYAYPFAMCKFRSAGRGFLFVQSNSSLAVVSLPGPILSDGKRCKHQRSIVLNWLTMKEYDSEVCMDDFELAGVRRGLKNLVERYDEKVEVPVLMRFRCGHVAVGIAPLVPDFNLCMSLGKDYETVGDALQLNIDDM